MRLITAKQASELLGVRLARLYELARLGLVPCVRLGQRQYRFDTEAIRQWIERGGSSEANKRVEGS